MLIGLVTFWPAEKQIGLEVLTGETENTVVGQKWRS